MCTKVSITLSWRARRSIKGLSDQQRVFQNYRRFSKVQQHIEINVRICYQDIQNKVRHTLWGMKHL